MTTDDGTPPGMSAMTPPHDLDMEQAILGAALISPSTIDDILDTGLVPEDFYRTAHEALWTVILKLYADGNPVEAASVWAIIRAEKVSLPEGGVYLQTLMAACTSPSTAPYYARKVRKYAVRRRLVAAGMRVMQLGYAADAESVEEILSIAAQEVDHIGSTAVVRESVNFGDNVDVVLDRIEKPLEDDTGGVEWPYESVRDVLKPMRPGQMIIVSARPGVGKSTLTRDIARDAAFRQRKRVLLFTLEMSREETEDAIIAAEGRISLDRVTAHMLTDGDHERIARARAEIDGSVLIIEDALPLTVAGMNASIRRNRPDIVIVDQIQLMTPTPSGSGRKESRQEEVGGLSRAIKVAAKSHGIPVVICSKMNRESEKATDKRPTMANLRDSGDLESDADVVILLHRDDMDNKESENAGDITVIVEKQRLGTHGVDRVLKAQMYYSRLCDKSA